MTVLLFILRKINNVKLHIDGSILEYSNRHIHFRIDKSNHSKIEWTCGGYRVCFSDGTRKTYNFTLLSKKEQTEVDTFFDNVRTCVINASGESHHLHLQHPTDKPAK